MARRPMQMSSLNIGTGNNWEQGGEKETSLNVVINNFNIIYLGAR